MKLMADPEGNEKQSTTAKSTNKPATFHVSGFVG
jgi:hypothetical protein